MKPAAQKIPPALPVNRPTDFSLMPLIQSALAEDLGLAGDITTAALIDPDSNSRAQLVARQAGVVAGMDLARLAFAALDSAVNFQPLHQDGDAVAAGAILARVQGKSAAIVIGERVALNFLCHLSGIANATAAMVAAVRASAHPETKICCTRKTLPGLRLVQKYAVRCGGGVNHRFGLFDAVLIKDNHLAAVGGNIVTAVHRARQAVGHLVKIEIEVDTLSQLQEIIDQNLMVDTVLLDNMDNAQLRQAVIMVKTGGGGFSIEASGGVTLARVAAIAETGVDFISCGSLTHSSPSLDIGLDFD